METPKLLAEFVLDPAGQPQFVEGDSEKQYKLRLFLKDIPKDAAMVQYELHPTYYRPVRNVPYGVKDFQEYTTSYGDYEIKASLYRKDSAVRLATTLIAALRDNYSTAMTPEIQGAITDLSLH